MQKKLFYPEKNKTEENYLIITWKMIKKNSVRFFLWICQKNRKEQEEEPLINMAKKILNGNYIAKNRKHNSFLLVLFFFRFFLRFVRLEWVKNGKKICGFARRLRGFSICLKFSCKLAFYGLKFAFYQINLFVSKLI